MSLVDKLKNILFDDIEEVEEEEIQIKQIQKGETKQNNFDNLKNPEVKFEDKFNIPRELENEFDEEKIKSKDVSKESNNKISSTRNVTERELFRSNNDFKFPEFDEEEFKSTVKKEYVKEPVSSSPSSRVQKNTNVLEYERKRALEKKNERSSRYERIEKTEMLDKKKFQPSPIISPVYGVLYQDYVADDIVKRGEEKERKKIDIDLVRKKAFESNSEKIEIDIREEEKEDPVVTFFEEKETIKVNNDIDSLNSLDKQYKNLDNLLETASEEVDIEDTIEIPRVNNFDQIEEELNKFETDDEYDERTDERFDNELFDLIDSMYENREE